MCVFEREGRSGRGERRSSAVRWTCKRLGGVGRECMTELASECGGVGLGEKKTKKKKTLEVAQSETGR